MSKKISRRNRRIRNLLLVISMMMVVAMASVGVTVAWLMDSTDSVVNTFTSSDVDITLSESANSLLDDEDNDANTNSYKMVPGNTIAKDPQVTVLAKSEACWLFVKLEKNATYGTYLADYVMAEGWLPLADVDGVYYREVADTDADQPFYVLKDNQVTVLTSVTKTQMNNLDNGTTVKPTLTVTAYACQKANVDNAATAWTTINAK